MRILGIDPGARATGYGVIDSDGNRHRICDQGVIVVKASLSFPEKLHRIYEALVELLDRHRPSQLAVESLFYASNVKTALKLGHVRGVALLAGVSRGLPVYEYAPLAVKQAVVGYGRADKEQVSRMVTILLELEQAPASHDASDALAIAICHAHQIRFSEKVLERG